MTLIGRIRASRLSAPVRERAHWYADSPAPSLSRDAQLSLLNAEWDRATRNVPYFSRLRSERSLPELFSSLEEFRDLVPPMNRGTLQQHRAALCSSEAPPDFQRITGGSTAEPIQIPAWKTERGATTPDVWVGRSWYGIGPDSRLFLLWGHSHLLGTGPAGWLRARQREFFDRVLGYHRHSAYDLRPEALKAAADVMLRFRPDYVIGYSVALDLFSRAARGYRAALRQLGVRVIVAAAEGFPASDSEERLSDLFDCPVAMEYGSVETNLIAHTRPEGGYGVFWRSYLLEVDSQETRGPALVTSLYPRCVPLIRYEIGDEIECSQGSPSRLGITEFSSVRGRCNDYARLAGGKLVHSEAFTHAVRPCTAIRSYQVVEENGGLEMRYTSELDLPEDEEAGIRERLSRVEPELAHLGIRRVETLEQTIAGKTPMILRRGV